MFRAAPLTPEMAQPRPSTDRSPQPASNTLPSVSPEKNNASSTTNIGVDIHGEKPVVRKTEVQVDKGTGVRFGRDSNGAVLQGSKVTVGTEQVDTSIKKGAGESNKSEEGTPSPPDTNKRSSTTDDHGIIVDGTTPVIGGNTVIGGGIEIAPSAVGALVKGNLISPGEETALYNLGSTTVISGNYVIPSDLKERESPYFEGCGKPLGSIEGRIEASERPTPYRELSTGDLSKRSLTMVSALRGFASEMKEEEELIGQGIKPKQGFQEKYESHFKSEVLLLRAEMLRRLPERDCFGEEIRSLYLTVNPVDGQIVEQFASMLEKLAKLLPNSLSKN